MNADSSRPDHLGFAILMIVVGMIFVSASDLVSKAIIPHVSIWSMLFIRSFLGLVFLIPILLIFRKMSAIKTRKLQPVLWRSLLMSLCYLSFYLALAKVPIALVSGAFFCAPFFMVLLSRVMLGEAFDSWRSSSLIAGFIGILMVLQPTSAKFDPLLILALLSSFLYALCQVLTRKYCKNEDPIALTFWSALIFMLTGLVGIVGLWLMPSLIGIEFLNRPTASFPIEIFLLLCFIGICSILAHFAISAAYQNGPSSLVGPLEYSYLPIVVIGGYFFYGEKPNILVLIGILMIILAGLVVAWRQKY